MYESTYIHVLARHGRGQACQRRTGFPGKGSIQAYSVYQGPDTSKHLELTVSEKDRDGSSGVCNGKRGCLGLAEAGC